MRPEDRFYVASITKTFVGTLALELVERKKLRLDSPIGAYLDGWPDGDQITVRQLLNHSSGIPPLGGDRGGEDPYSEDFSALVIEDLHRRFTVDEILAFVRDRRCSSRRGSAVSYSNVNTILLGQIIATVTGVSLGTALRTELFEPLELTATSYAAEKAPPIAPVPGLFPDRFRRDAGQHRRRRSDQPHYRHRSRRRHDLHRRRSRDVGRRSIEITRC